MKNINKKRAFTLTEVIIAIAVFLIMVVGFSAGMVTLYNNSRREHVFTKEMYESQSEIESASVLINDNYLSNKGILSAGAKKDVKDKHNLKLVEVPTLTVFGTDSKYNCKVSGCTVGSFEEEDNDRLVLFLSNDYVLDEVTVPIVENLRIINSSVKHEYRETKAGDVNDVDFIYMDSDYLKNPYNVISKFYSSGLFYGIEGAYTIKPGTADTLFYDTYKWYYSKGFNKDNKPFEPVFPSADGSVPENAIGKDFPIEEDEYTEYSVKTKIFPSSKLKKLAVDGRDFFVRFRVLPKTVTNLQSVSRLSLPIRIIALPETFSMIYHLDISMEGAYLTNPGQHSEIDYVRNLPTYINNSTKSEPANQNLRKRSGDKINVYKDSYYGKYMILDGRVENSLIGKTGEDKKYNYFSLIKLGGNQLTLFMVLDLDGAHSGTLIERINEDLPAIPNDLPRYFNINYDSRKKAINFYSGRKMDSRFNSVTVPLKKSGKQIITVKTTINYASSGDKGTDWDKTVRTNYLAAGDLSFMVKELGRGVGKELMYQNDKNQTVVEKKGWAEKFLYRDGPLYVGGKYDSAGGAKIYEIIGYSDPLDDTTVETIYKYLKNKHGIR